MKIDISKQDKLGRFIKGIIPSNKIILPKEKLRRLYKKYGYRLLVIWGKDLKDKDKLLNKILKFTNGGEDMAKRGVPRRDGSGKI